MTPIFTGKILGGKMVIDNHIPFVLYLRTLEGQEITAVIGRPKKTRSNNENRYYWGVVVKLLSETTGYSDDEMHDALRMLFLIDRDKTIPTIRSTASLTTVEFESYLSKIRAWASETLNCYVPEPNEVEF